MMTNNERSTQKTLTQGYWLTAAVRCCQSHAEPFLDVYGPLDPVTEADGPVDCPFCRLAQVGLIGARARPYDLHAPGRYFSLYTHFATWICKACGQIVDWETVIVHNLTCQAEIHVPERINNDAS